MGLFHKTLNDALFQLKGGFAESAAKILQKHKDEAFEEQNATLKELITALQQYEKNLDAALMYCGVKQPHAAYNLVLTACENLNKIKRVLHTLTKDEKIKLE